MPNNEPDYHDPLSFNPEHYLKNGLHRFLHSLEMWVVGLLGIETIRKEYSYPSHRTGSILLGSS